MMASGQPQQRRYIRASSATSRRRNTTTVNLLQFCFVFLLLAPLALLLYRSKSLHLLMSGNHDADSVGGDSASDAPKISKPRLVVKKVLAVEQPEGEGARVRRSIGRPELKTLDPFLMLDYFAAKPPGGFPDHPHRGFETVTYMLESEVHSEKSEVHSEKSSNSEHQCLLYMDRSPLKNVYLRSLFPSNRQGPFGRTDGQPFVRESSLVMKGRGVQIIMGACRSSLFSTSPFSASHSASTLLQRRLGSRWMSNLPEATVYGGPISQASVKRVTLRQLQKKYATGQPITMVTAYDYPSAVHVDQAGIDVALVGDSVAMVVHGHDTTLPITLDDMLLHCRAVARGAQRPLLVGDLPFGSYEQSTQQAVDSATRMLKEGGMDAVKMEGGIGSRVAAARAIAEAGIAVMGHVGLTPQAISVLGGFRPQGRSSGGAVQVLEHALALQDAGCFSLVLECLPSPVAAALTATLEIPTIGIGAGPQCSGQVLVYHDILGMMQHPHYLKVTPKFCKLYAKVGEVVQAALSEYSEEVSTGVFPSPAHTPYRLEKNQLEPFIKELENRGFHDAAEAAHGASKVDQEADSLKTKISTG